ncbi:hypothetical protein FB451DRAFT_1168524 [Mycena latifolia]|nr:hypothetical protein FB451DRAFT_1168524 [Mycena latifolia]
MLRLKLWYRSLSAGPEGRSQQANESRINAVAESESIAAIRDCIESAEERRRPSKFSGGLSCTQLVHLTASKNSEAKEEEVRKKNRNPDPLGSIVLINGYGEFPDVMCNFAPPWSGTPATLMPRCPPSRRGYHLCRVPGRGLRATRPRGPRQRGHGRAAQHVQPRAVQPLARLASEGYALVPEDARAEDEEDALCDVAPTGLDLLRIPKPEGTFCDDGQIVARQEEVTCVREDSTSTPAPPSNSRERVGEVVRRDHEPPTANQDGAM